ncbi:MAG: ATP-dependent DNA helicase RecG [Geobacteraceae bacterium]|nr:ATP-dependent DNA helicase RecG [Geobacteraceae bacterium]
MPVIKVDAEGRILLPREILEVLCLKPGDDVQVEAHGSTAVLSRVNMLESAIAKIDSLAMINRRNLETAVRLIKGVGPKMAAALAKKGIHTVEDALYLLPYRYEDRRQLRSLDRLRPGQLEVFCAQVMSVETRISRGGRRVFEAVVSDGRGAVLMKWFNFSPRHMAGIWRPGRKGIFSGEVVFHGHDREIHHPEVDWLAEGADPASFMADDPVNFGRTIPVYPLTEGLRQKPLRKVQKEIVDVFSESVETAIPGEILERRSLMPLAAALREVHFPGNDTAIDVLERRATRAHRTLAFDEFFFLQLGLALKKRGVSIEQGIPFQVTHKYTRQMVKSLPFALTAAQKRVLADIKGDLAAPYPMHRLVQGDVGSGKTVVAILTALLAVENDCQVVIMAPTEILAEQHFLAMRRYCEQLGIATCLLTSRVKGKERTRLLEDVACGNVSVIIGTHSVIQEKVEFKRLGLGIIDEQHRFGVLQRGILRKKGQNPHIMVMTATPIPRTLAMTVFGDLSLSVIDELPPGRSPVATRICPESQRQRVYQLIRDEVRAGRQAYVIYPLVEESEKSDLKAATLMAEHLAGDVFPELRIGLLHGKMKPEEKETVMGSFKCQQIDILVATTIIEVGIDVPNATVMVIEHAERFGLSQLHQLRGRVGRGTVRSHCVLLCGDDISGDAARRLKVLEQTTDGFRIAEADLELRGPGDFLGTRQAGLPEFRVADILRDGLIMEEARQEAFALVERDPLLSLPENGRLRGELVRRWGGRLELAGC